MSRKLSRREFLRLAGTTTLAGVLAACSQPAPEATPEAPKVEEGEEVEEAPVEVPEAPAETAVLDYFWVANQDTDQRPLVEAAINEYIEPLIGANVSFHLIPWGDWATKAVTGLQAGEKIDIFFTADWYYYMQLASEGLFRALNDDDGEFGNLFEEYGQGILAGLAPAFVPGTQIDGVNYAVPTNKELTVPEGFLYNIDLAEEIGMTEADAAAIKNYDDLKPWLEKAKAARPDEYPYITSGRDGFKPWPQDVASGVSGDLINMYITPDANGVWDETIYVLPETDEEQSLYAHMREFYENEWIHPDAGLDTYDPNQPFNAGQFFLYPMPLKGNNIKAQEMINSSGNADLRVGEIYGQAKVNITTHAGGSMLAIPTLSDYAVQAMKYINLMHSDSKLVNMQLFGVEGTHWEFEDDGRVNLLDSGWYGAHPGAWTVGNIMMQAVTNKEDPDKNRLLVEYAFDSLDHIALGFRFRTEPVAPELTAVNAVLTGTMRGLRTGYIDPEEVLDTFIADLEAAGVYTIRDEVETQYTAWREATS
ncbi:MAG: extracellular solute-binding protein [Anaerolineae bacterium]|nr:extracellular solute-binding protein [Anaerolineae bacterium]